MPDDRVRSAIAHWAPRFIANGVDGSDFQQVTAGIEEWGSWCSQWSLAAGKHEDLGKAALAEGRHRTAGTHLAQAAAYYHFAKFMFVNDLDQMREAHGNAVRCMETALPYLDPPGERVSIPYRGTSLAAFLRRPSGPGPHPLVVLIPGLDSAKEEFGGTEEAFLRRGLATLSVDGPGQGESEYELAIEPAWEIPGSAIFDAAAALPGIDPERIGVWGVSLGGYYVARWASADPRLKATVALCGPYNLGRIWDDLPELSRAAFRVRSKSDSDEQARARALELDMAGHSEAISSPLLVITGKKDRLFPWQDAQRLCEEAGSSAELLLLENGNHGCANVIYQHRPYSGDWLASKLAA